jgi:hypothetical protein
MTTAVFTRPELNVGTQRNRDRCRVRADLTSIAPAHSTQSSRSERSAYGSMARPAFCLVRESEHTVVKANALAKGELRVPTEDRHTPVCAGRSGSARLTAPQTLSSSEAQVSATIAWTLARPRKRQCGGLLGRCRRVDEHCALLVLRLTRPRRPRPRVPEQTWLWRGLACAGYR